MGLIGDVRRVSHARFWEAFFPGVPGQPDGSQASGRDAAAGRAEVMFGDGSGSDQNFEAAGVISGGIHASEDAVHAGDLG